MPSLVDNYNNEPHGSLDGLTPTQALLPKNKTAVLDAQKKKYRIPTSSDLKFHFSLGE